MAVRLKLRLTASGGAEVITSAVLNGGFEIDAGIDALGVRIESFAPGRWRFAEETRIRETEAPEYW